MGYARISHGGLTDTEVQMARFRIPENHESYTDNVKIEKNPAKVDPDIRFPERFSLNVSIKWYYCFQLNGSLLNFARNMKNCKTCEVKQLLKYILTAMLIFFNLYTLNKFENFWLYVL